MSADPTNVYLYTPPMMRMVYKFPGAWALRFGINTSTIVYRQDGVWHNIAVAGMDNPVVADCDVDAQSGMLLFFNKPMVVPGWLADELVEIEPADLSWSFSTLTQL